MSLARTRTCLQVQGPAAFDEIDMHFFVRRPLPPPIRQWRGSPGRSSEGNDSGARKTERDLATVQMPRVDRPVHVEANGYEQPMVANSLFEIANGSSLFRIGTIPGPTSEMATVLP